MNEAEKINHHKNALLGDGSLLVANLSLQLQSHLVLDNISFALPQGGHLAITGPSGSGKTILAKALGGKMFYHGTATFVTAKPRIVFIEQHYHFKNTSNTGDFYYQQRYNSFESENTLTVADELNIVSADAEKKNELLNRLQLQHRKDSPLLQLSSGEHKRFQLIKGFLQDADVFIIDSPFIGLDVNSRQHLHSIINEKAAAGATIIVIAEAHQLPTCITHVAFLQNGRLKIFEGKDEFLASTIHQLQVKEAPQEDMPFAPATGNFEVALKMDNVRVAYGQKVIISNISWQVNQGEKWLLKGVNGAGKSTLLSLITGDHPQAYANRIVLFDRKRGSGETIWDIKKKIGYVSPELHWYFDTNATCYNAIASGFFDTVGLYRKLDSEQEKMVQQWLTYLRLTAVQNKQLATISTSQQRLVLLARALVKNPPLLILDEPCQGLDEEQVKQFVRLTDTLCTGLNNTLIYVSHYAHEIPGCIDHVLELLPGKQNIYSIAEEAAIAV
jgi:molybdate transport system ATP-binding protein